MKRRAREEDDRKKEKIQLCPTDKRNIEKRQTV